MNNTIAILALRKINGIGAVGIKKLWQQGVFDDRNYCEIIEHGCRLLKKPQTNQEQEEFINSAKQIIALNQDEEINMLDISSPKYPRQLKAIKAPPSIIYYKGNIERSNKTIGVIGTREPSSTSLEIARRIGQYFSNEGFSICNGLAQGIDEASIKNDSGIHSNVVGVVAGGLNYNKTKTLLKSTALMAEQVLESGGLVLSEYPCNIKEDTFKVVDSCALQAGLSNGLILIQSKATGGSKYTLEAYAELNRPFGVIVLPGMESDPLYEANTKIIQNTKSGLAEITGLKPDKIKIEKCYGISQKSDYAIFENAVLNTINKENISESLF